MTFRLATAIEIRERRLFATAFIRSIGAARVQQAAVGTVIFPRHYARQRRQTRFILGKLRQRAQQRLSTAMPEHLAGQDWLVQGRIVGLPQQQGEDWRLLFAPDSSPAALRLPLRLPLQGILPSTMLPWHGLDPL